ncbi:hypothetical protein OIU76_000997 [Salix suchowensis]|uniref:TF-B3 domain-containing protein n=1 Tax=Salix suchowensis TaxID=1278906 RepID=A0ABQ9B848_9ROSI|nr:hypothetical protein OIU76_000997 [Salix suchowensis]KAJ6376086.1 hypothetical protein OIU77_000957 [Salix suchowensis]
MTTFSKPLSKTDTKTLSVPTKYLRYLPSFKGGHAVSFQAMDESGVVRTFKCSTRKEGYKKPVLSKGWRAFVRDKKLKVGDKIKFSVLDPTAAIPSYEVRAEKEVKIFGAIFGYSPIIIAPPNIP